MSKTYILTPRAEADLWSIIDYISEHSEQNAMKVFDELEAAMENLCRMPGMGHMREDVTDRPVRFWAVYSFLIVYWPESNPLRIVRIIHGARDLKSVLELE